MLSFLLFVSFNNAFGKCSYPYFLKSLFVPRGQPTLLENNEGFKKFHESFLQQMSKSEGTHISIEHATQFANENIIKLRKSLVMAGEADKLNSRYGLPQEFIKYFSKKTGEFKYHRSVPLSFSSESGRQELKMVRISFLNNDFKVLTDHGWREDILRSYGEAMQKIPGFKLLVSVAPGDIKIAKKIVEKFPKTVRKRIILQKVDGLGPKHVWTQDGSKPISSAFPTTAKPGVKVIPSYDLTIDAFVNQKKIESVTSLFKFEGGNIIVGEKNIFIGTNEINYNMDKFFLTRDEVLAALKEEYSLPVIEIGSVAPLGHDSKQLDFHIDLSMSVIFDHLRQKEVVLLESPQLFIEKLSKMPSSAFQTSEEKLFLKKINELDLSSVSAMNRQRYLDEVEKTLKQNGYEVVRVPGYNEDAYKMINITNAIFSGKNAIVPQTGFIEIDRDYQTLLKSFGYETVVPMNVVQYSSKERGGIRCLSETYRKDNIEWTRPFEKR